MDPKQINVKRINEGVVTGTDFKFAWVCLRVGVSARARVFVNAHL